MPLTYALPDALAQTYARSLFELADSHGGSAHVEEVLGEIEDLLEIARHDGQFSEFLSSRALPARLRDQSLRRILQGRVSDLTLRFLLLLNDKQRLGHLIPITQALDAMVQERFGRVEVDVYTAAPIGADEQRLLRQRLADALGKDVVVHPYVDGGMIGGVKVRIGDQLIDASISTRLRKMREQLQEHGGAQLRSRINRILDQ